ncbi:MAG: PD-(D/E)XK nuclease family protein [Bacteroidales bacterium]|nr:PD-(D/E)XK nuclease family protein [Bacteroidales bacterium]
MQPFLHQLAVYLTENYKDGLSRLCVVFPNRRAGLFLSQYISQLINKPVWLPDIFALEDFVTLKSGLIIPDQLSLLVQLYKTYQSIDEIKAKSFAEFQSWGTMLLNDFDELDQYLVDGEEVFGYLDEIKAMNHWNPDGEALSAFETDYLKFFNSLAPIYRNFKEILNERNEGYFGMAFEQMLSTLDDHEWDHWDTIIFAGFNALTTAEEKLIKHFIERGKAEVIWDADAYYLDDKRQEAGVFLRNFLKDKAFGEPRWIGQSFRNDSKKISVIGVPGNIGQAKLAGQLISELVVSENPSDIALVLVDESLLLPVMNSMPAELNKFNVTMGYPLKLTPAFSLFDSVFRLWIQALYQSERLNSGKSKNSLNLRFYHKDIDRFLKHPYFQPFINKEKKTQNGSSDYAGKSFLAPEEFIHHIQQSLPEISGMFETVIKSGLVDSSAILDLIQQLISYLRPSAKAPDIPRHGSSDVDTEFLYQFALLTRQLKKAVQETDLLDGVGTLYEVFKSQSSALRLPFYGEPLNGLQMMGVLETRTLDFKNVIMLSANEGMIPKGKHQNTFIPFEVRKAFNLQLYSERNAVFSYHFYRLLQRAENVYLLYNTEGTDLGGGEKSRFITQIQLELPQYNPAIIISESICAIPPEKAKETVIEIRKTDDIQLKLKQLAERGFSPTALSKYLNCSLQFCYSQVMEIKEPEEVEDTLDAATLGEAVHEALYQVFIPFKHNIITTNKIDALIPTAIANVKKVFASRFKQNDMDSGKNLLILKVAENMVKRFLIAEKEHLEEADSSVTGIEIIQLEEWLNSEIEIQDLNSEIPLKVLLRGKADRIDRIGNKIRVIDYKTGLVDKNDLKIENVEHLREMDNPSKLLQLLIYAWMYRKMNNKSWPANISLVSGIISLRQSSQYLINATINKTDDLSDQIIADIEMLIYTIVEDIFNPNISFQQTENLDHCIYCPYKSLCNR